MDGGAHDTGNTASVRPHYQSSPAGEAEFPETGSTRCDAPAYYRSLGILAVFLLQLLLLPRVVAALDAPHNEAGGISCPSCHGQARVSSPFWGGTVSDDDYDKFCLLNCHDKPTEGDYTPVDAPWVQTHSSTTTSETYGTWSFRCLDCHDPHGNQQNNRSTRRDHEDELYLGTGDIDAYSYDSGTGETTINFSGLVRKGGWTAGDYLNKTGLDRRALLLPNYRSPNYSYPIIGMTDNGDGTGTFTVSGNIAVVRGLQRYPFAITYNQLVHDEIDIDGTGPGTTIRKPVFLDQTGPYSFAHNDQAAGDLDIDGNPDDSTPTGICQVCHQSTTHYRNDGTLASLPDTVHASYNGGRCTTCHPHEEGFNPNYPDHYATTTPYVTDYVNAGDANCVTCHSSPDPKDYVANAHNRTCSSCHTDYGSPPALKTGANGDAAAGAAPQPIGPYPEDGAGCLDCHENGTTITYGTDFAGAAGHKVQDHSGATGASKCTGCHAGDIITAAYTHNNSCAKCHNNVTDNGSLRAGADGNGTAAGHVLGTSSTCLDCHEDGSSYTYGTDFAGAAGHKVQDHSGVTGGTCQSCHTGDVIAAVHSVSTTADNTADTCTDCHTSITSDGTLTDGTGAATPYAATRVGDASGHIVGAASGCEDCHGQAVYGDNYFSYHQNRHSSVTFRTDTGDNATEISCVECHRKDQTFTYPNSGDRTGTNDKVVDTIHATLTVFADRCWNCHTDPTGELTSGANGDATGQPGVDDIVFCNECHADYAADFATAHDTSDHSGVSGATSCTGCHAGDPITAAYTHNSTCAACHTNTTADGSFRDGANGWGDATVHVLGTTSDCLDCHDISLGGPGTDFDGGSHSDYDHSGITGSTGCTGCHAGDIITAAYTHNSTCTDCHTDITGNGSLRDGANGWGDATVHALGESNDCVDCHDVSLGGPGTDFDGGSHDDYDHSGVGGTASCRTCHTGDIIGAVHNNTCTDCHTNTGTNGSLRAGANGDATVHALGSTSTCADCHSAYAADYKNHDQDHAGHADHSAHIDSSAGDPNYCTDCHTSADAGSDSIVDYHRNNCDNCHTPTTGVLHAGNHANSRGGATSYGDATAGFVHNGSRACVICHIPDADGALADGESHALDNVGSLQTAHNNYLASDGSLAESCSDCHEDDTAAERLALHLAAATETADCLTCHTDADTGITVVNNGKSTAGSPAAQSCEDCHTGEGVNRLHGLTEADVNDEHDNFASSSQTDEWRKCQYCHTAITASQRVDLHPACTTCHSRHATDNGTNKLDVVNSGRDSGNIVDNYGYASGGGAIQYCESCHQEKDNDDGGTDDDLSYTMHGLTDDNGVDGVVDIHNNLNSAAGRSVTYSGKLASAGALKASTYSCADCHAADRSTVTDLEAIQLHTLENGSGYGNCLTCHTATGIKEQVDNGREAGHHVGGGAGQLIECEDCHNTGYDEYSPSGGRMYQYDGERHHSTARAQAGDCTWCHADPRPSPVDTSNTADVTDSPSGPGYAATADTDGDPVTGWGADFTESCPTDIPEQMACRLCHTNYETYTVDVRANNGDHGYGIGRTANGLSVYANDYYAGPATFPSGDGNINVNADRVTQSEIHRIEANDGSAMIQVRNFGACFGCHTVQVMHASPLSSDMTTPDVNDENTVPWDTLRYAPGRSVFNRFRGARSDNASGITFEDHARRDQWGKDHGCEDQGRCDQFYKDYNAYSNWNWGSHPDDALLAVPVNAAFNNYEALLDKAGNDLDNSSTYQIVEFDTNAPLGAMVVPDAINIASANWDGTDVDVVVYNSRGSGQTLRLTYSGGACANAPVDLTWVTDHYEGTCTSPGAYSEGVDYVTVENLAVDTDLDIETRLVETLSPASAVADSYTVLYNDSTSLAVLANDTGTGISLLSLDDTGLNANCSVAINGSNVDITCGAALGDMGSFDYTIQGLTGGPSSATVSISTTDDPPPVWSSISAPAGDSVTAGEYFEITYDFDDPNETTVASFYYDTDTDMSGGTLITDIDCTDAAENADGGGSCTWDTYGVTPGTYYVYGVANDGTSTVSRLSAGTITVSNCSSTAAILDGWSQVASGTSDTPSGTFSISSGSDRLLIVAVTTEETNRSGSAPASWTVTYGGQPLTMITATADNRASNVWIGYLKETGISSASDSTIQVSVASPNDYTKVHAVSLRNVNQAGPVAASNSDSSTGQVSGISSGNLTWVDDDQVLYVATFVEDGRWHSVEAGYTEDREDTFGNMGTSAGHRDSTAAGTDSIFVSFERTDYAAIAGIAIRSLCNDAPNNTCPEWTAISQPDGVGDSVAAGGIYDITYTFTDSDDVVAAAFYYDTDTDMTGGTAISGDCAAAPEGTGVTCAWDTSGVTPGTYWVYGVADDGVNPPRSRLSDGQITITIPPVSLVGTWNQSVTGGSANSATLSNFDAGAGTNRVLVVAVGVEDSGTDTVSSAADAVQWGGTNVPVVQSDRYGGGYSESAWIGVLAIGDSVSPQTDNVTVSFTNTVDAYIVTAVVFGYADQVTPVTYSNSANGTGEITTTVQNPQDGRVVYGVSFNGTGTDTVTPATGFIEGVEVDSGGTGFRFETGYRSSTDAVGSVTVDPTTSISSDRTALVGLAINPQ